MTGHQMAAAFLAILALAHWRLLVHADMIGAGRDPYGAGLPERESVDGSA
jgi:hypothetical protein